MGVAMLKNRDGSEQTCPNTRVPLIKLPVYAEKNWIGLSLAGLAQMCVCLPGDGCRGCL
jgi:hypothetical protein